jgi:hypothetical protein
VNYRDHAAHDPLLVAAHAAGDASGADLARAAALVASCPDCARLHRDLRALPGALASAPAPARPHDFRLTAEQAEALRRPSGWRRLLAPLSGARSSAGPLAASLAALGIAGVLLGGGLSLGLGGSATSAPAPQAAAAGSAASGGSETTGAVDSRVDGPSAAASIEGRPDTPDPSPIFAMRSQMPQPQPRSAPSSAASQGAGPDATPTTPIDRERAIAIARAASPRFAKDQVFDTQLGTFAALGNAYGHILGTAPEPGALVWVVDIGWRLGPLDARGAIVVIDASDGHVVQTFEWIA